MIKQLIIDVDGTLTDAGVYYNSRGQETKKFSTKDGAGFFIAKAAGIKLIILTGRESEAVLRRMTELKADMLLQNIKDKGVWLKHFMTENKIDNKDVGYIGDDVNDLPPMRMCGFVGCPADACREVKALANYISPVKGGHGAVRDCIEHLLTESGDWGRYVKQVYGSAGI